MPTIIILYHTIYMINNNIKNNLVEKYTDFDNAAERFQ
jgi:hypothetical protein